VLLHVGVFNIRSISGFSDVNLKHSTPSSKLVASHFGTSFGFGHLVQPNVIELLGICLIILLLNGNGGWSCLDD